MGGRGGYGGTIVGALILTVLSLAPDVAGLPGGGPPDPVRRDHRRRRGGLHAGDRRDLMDAERTRPAPSRHLGLDLGGTNIKWVVVERDGDDWRRPRPRPGPDTRRRAVPDRSSSPRLAEVGAEAIGRSPGVTSVGIGIPGLYDPAAGTTRFLVNIPGAWAGKAGGRARRRRRSALPAALINDARAFGLAELRLGAGRGARLDDRPDARHRRRRRHRHRRPRRTRATTARAASSATRRSTPTGRRAAAATAAASRPSPGPTASPRPAGPPTAEEAVDAGARRRPAGGRGPARQSGATWASASPT